MKKFLIISLLFLLALNPCKALDLVMQEDCSASMPFQSSRDSDTILWLARVAANGGSVSPAAIRGVDNSIKFLKYTGYWSNILIFYPMVGDQWEAMWTPVVGAQWTDGVVALNHSTAYAEATGVTGDGLGWINSNQNQNTLSTTNNSICIYARDAVGIGVGMAYIGATGSDNVSQLQKHSALGTQIILNAGEASQGKAYVTDLTAALWCGTRTASNSISIYRNKTNVGTNGAATTQPYTWANKNIYVMASNNDGVVTGIANGLILAGVIVLKQGMTQTDVNNIYAAFKMWNDPVGRTGLRDH